MKNNVRGKKAAGAVLLAALLVVLVIIPLSAGAGDNPGEGSIPVPGSFDVDSYGEDTGSPEALKEGQIWVNKNVFDNEDGTFEITLYAWGAAYTDDDGDDGDDGGAALPLDPEYQAVTITDVIGGMFDYDAAAGADHSVGDFNVAGGVATWVVAQTDILGESAQACTFTVKLKEGWVVDTKYYTNEAASAQFTPALGNPYYYKTVEWTETYYKTIELNWNQGNGNGLNSFTITDDALGATMESGSINAGTDITVTVDGRAPQTFKFNGAYSSGTQAYTEPVDALDGEWGFYWIREDGKLKTYQFWFKGIEGPGIVTRYDISPGNNGGRETFTIGVSTKDFSETVKIDRPWKDDGPVIEEALPNRGMVEISCVTIIVYKEVTGDSFTGARPAFVFGLYDNESCEGAPVATATLSGSADDMRAFFQFGISILSDYFGEGEEEAVFWIKEIAGTASANGGTWKFDEQIVEVCIGADGSVAFSAEIEEGVDYPVFVNSFKLSDVVITTSPSPSPDPSPITGDGDPVYSSVRTSTTPAVTEPAADPEVPFDIFDDGPPLADFPPMEPLPVDEIVVELDDDDVPLGDMPQTGIESMLPLWIAGVCASMLVTGLIARVIYRGKKEK